MMLNAQNVADTLLSQPLRLRKLIIPNRLGKSAVAENMADSKGMILPEYQSYYTRLSQGGAGLLITGHFYVLRDGRTFRGMAGADSDTQIPLLKQVTTIVHKTETKIFAQLNHAGAKAFPEPQMKKSIKAPSPQRRATALTLNEIEAVIESFGQAALRLKKAEFDGIQIHGAHSYLIAQFLSKQTNKRTDSYGGSLENRQRFCFDVYQRIRDAVGTSYPVIIKLDSYSHNYTNFPLPVKNITLTESLQTAQRLVDAGIDAIEVSCGFHAARGMMPLKKAMITQLHAQGDPQKATLTGLLTTPLDIVLNRRFWFKPQHNIHHIRIFKQKLDIPILAGSGFRNPCAMRQVLKNGEADMICLARPLIIDPDFPNKILSGSLEQSTCINCNLCLVLLPNKQPITCYYIKPEHKD